jgi:hypothetical protein
VTICAEKIQQLREIPGISGVNLVSAGEPELLVAVLDAAGIVSTA